jgi:AcrR family transcriptional regulator
MGSQSVNYWIKETLVAESAAKQDDPVKGKGQLKREATEAALIDAFGRVVQRSGLRNVGVNEVIKEAGIGKALLYRYFGGLPGLVHAWGEKNRMWPDLSELSELSDSLEAVGASDQLKTMVRHHGETLREDPLRVEILADEFMSETPISASLSEIRQQLGKEHAGIFAKNKHFQDNHMLMVILMAAASYLAMRAAKAPWYMGENIGSEQGWSHLMDHIDEIIDQALGDEK